MKIIIGADKLGYPLKEAVKAHLLANGHDVRDLGTLDPENPVDYISVADRVAAAVVLGEAERGIVLCGSGMGVSIVANKHKGAYCAHAESVWAAQNAREINDVNMLGIGAYVLGTRMACDIVDTFLSTQFAPGAAPERRAMLQDYLDRLASFEETKFR